MAKMVTINLFDVDWSKQTSQALSDTLEEFAAMQLSDRWRGDIRLEQVVKVAGNPATKMPDRYHLDFSKERAVGPGKLGRLAPISGIKMGQDESFGEETAAVYVPSKKWLLILNNQFGIGPTRMAEYFNAVDSIGAGREFFYSVSPQLDASILARLKGMSNLTSIQVTATIDALNAAQNPVGVSLARATQSTSAQKISFTLAANASRKKSNFLSMVNIKNMVTTLRSQAAGVSVLKLKGEDPTTGKKDQVIDLLEHKMKRQYRADELKVVNHRYTPQSRWELLDRALRGWL